ncbi:alpha-mannosidase [Acidipropionibacterium virtanenii]|uniref:Mannosylglycerate hydrolase n=1 Tax=Acidipropionibacterium virtanenii TaxID=2057246 RepID=A0A344UQN2_9ACTN|nr:glycoside hydrolase family 38 C-terminal domain-containing protein [Acidipropionibacterium virtanenii]AXE37580.1 Mannosylglycerate hydrolase [Acidipropionibacterium virtanenii]
MHDSAVVLDARVRRHLAEKIRPAETSVVSAVEVAAAPVTDAADSPDPSARPGVIGQGEPVPPVEGLSLNYEPIEIGAPWGPPWGTTWLRLRGTVPPEVRDEHLELILDLGGEYDSPGFQCEGLVFRSDGSVIKGLNPRNTWIPVEPDAEGRIEVYVEAASNPVLLGSPPFQPTDDGDKLTASHFPYYRLRRADLVLVHDEVRELTADVSTLFGLARELSDDSERAWEIRRALDRAMDRLDLWDVPGTAAAARARLTPVLARPATASAQVMGAVGHAHIDSAWLWPLRETRRKVARTVANQLNLIGRHPEHIFAFPAAQHWAWLQADHPDLFARLLDAVRTGNVVPVGGMWVESDANLPGGEAMCRQLLYGQRWFIENTGRQCEEVWLPDSFGYSGALPQLARLAGARWFLTQKISWNQVDRFPHHSFVWEGIDGTRIFTHFPPADTYGSDLSAHDLEHARSNFADKGRSNTSLLLFGYGDGGGGPTREMLAQAARTTDLDGSPKVQIETPQAFFARAEAEHEDPSVWAGELYLELHRGTFTNQARVKAANRRNEHLLRQAELWCATAAVRGLMDYPGERLAEIWREVCLYQFHDILPGTAIAWVYREVIAAHAAISGELDSLVDGAQSLLAGSGSRAEDEGVSEVVFDASPVARADTATTPMGAAVLAPTRDEVTLMDGPEGGFVVGNGLIRLAVDSQGRVLSLVDHASGRDVVPPGALGNTLELHPDLPNQWDGWDIDIFALDTTVRGDLGPAGATRRDDGSVQISAVTQFEHSAATLALTVRPGDPRLGCRIHVDWHERDALLKLSWPVDVHTDHASYEIEMGHISRPTHTNTSWDAYRFEVHAHRWVHVGEPGFGVAIANAQTYGWSVDRHERPGGGTFSTVRASLLKGARYPDPRADDGEHDFAFTIRPGAGIREAVADGYAANLPARIVPGCPVEPLIRVAGDVAVEAVKLAEDGSGDVVVRIYEPFGTRASATLSPSFEAADAVETDLLEEPLAGNPDARVRPTAVTRPLDDGRVEIALRPFQVATIRFRR